MVFSIRVSKVHVLLEGLSGALYINKRALLYTWSQQVCFLIINRFWSLVDKDPTNALLLLLLTKVFH